VTDVETQVQFGALHVAAPMLPRTQTLPRLMFNITAVVLALVLLQSALNAAVTTVQTLLTLNVEIGTVAETLLLLM
jgi:hypothetical protein